MVDRFSKRAENTGKRRNCSIRAISPFPTVFSKDWYCRKVKTRTCLGKGYGEVLLTPCRQQNSGFQDEKISLLIYGGIFLPRDTR